MTHIEQELNEYDQSNKIRMYLRYVHDTFLIANGQQSDVDQLIELVNKFHPKLRFTCEIEKNYEFSFLNVELIERRSKYEATIYKKETNTGQLLHWQSHQARKYKIDLIKTLKYWALIDMFI